MAIVLKTAKLVGTYEWIYPLDGAFDREREDFDESELFAAQESNDIDRLMRLCKPQHKPTRWKLRHLTGHAKRWAIDYVLERASERGHVSRVALRRLAAHALVGASDLTNDDGTPAVIRQEQIDPQSGCPVVGSELLDALDSVNSGDLLDRMGARVLAALHSPGN